MTEAGLPAFARGRVGAAALVSGLVLSAFSSGYGYDRDELYFRLLHPRWGYVDQGPLTPLIARAMSHVADTTWALRIPATVLTALTTVIVSLIARELGGGRGAQTLAAWGFAFAAVPVLFGHALLTATTDLPVWPAMLLFVIRAVRRADGRWWLAAGFVGGLSTYNKLLVVTLLLALLGGLLITGPRRLLASRWVLGAVVVLLLISTPNIVYQLTHGLPELDVGRAVADHKGSDVRVQMWPFLILMLGPPLVPIWVAGLVRLWRTRELRFIAAAFPVLLVLVFLMGAQVYYSFGLVAVLFGAGCVPSASWLSSRVRWRALMVAGLAVNTAVSLVLGLPLVPEHDLHSTPIAGINQLVRDSVGWPRYVEEVGGVYRRLPPDERAHAVLFASNYGEAGALARYGGAYHLPAVYSGQNQLGHESRPPSTATVVVVVGGEYEYARTLLHSCRVRTHLENHLGIDNEEQGEPVAVCRTPADGWQHIWPKLRHLD